MFARKYMFLSSVALHILEALWLNGSVVSATPAGSVLVVATKLYVQ